MDDAQFNLGYQIVWDEIAAAAINRRHSFRTFTLATVDGDGCPQARTLVLRGADPERRTIRFHADARSPKVAGLRANPAACALFYGSAEKLQVRAHGTVTIHRSDAVSAEAWREMQPMSRDVYRAPLTPGSETDAATKSLPLPEAFDNLAVCELTLSSLEWLSLSSEGHIRVRHEFHPDGTITAHRLQP